MKEHFRVVVIGGGIVGAAVLYHLTKLGWLDGREKTSSRLHLDKYCSGETPLMQVALSTSKSGVLVA